jgi:hypothetical protein
MILKILDKTERFTYYVGYDSITTIYRDAFSLVPLSIKS